MEIIYPGIILITDEFPWKNGAGIGQAMYNFFFNYPGRMYILQNIHERIPKDEESLEANPVYFKEPGPMLLNNRFGKWVNPWLKRRKLANLSSIKILPELPPTDQMIVLVATTDPFKLVLAWVLMNRDYKIIPFFMDDWLANSTLKWHKNDIHSIARDILSNALARIMISERLDMNLAKRYTLNSAPTLIIQNPAHEPADINGEGYAQNENSGIKQILYAGSIWPMHADALILLAATIHYSRTLNDPTFELILYCPEKHWLKYKVELQGSGVSWGGWLPTTQEVRNSFKKAWVLLCCASFLETNLPYSDSSIQSKISDYLPAGKPILYIGPQSGASAEFIEKLNCGYILSFNEPRKIYKGLNLILSSSEDYLKKGNNSLLAAENLLSINIVQKKLYDFLAENCTVE